MTEIIKTSLAITVIVILSILLFRECSKPKIICDPIPTTSGAFEKQKPVILIERDTTYITKWKTKDNTIVVKTQNPVNQELLDKYECAKDSIERFKMYVSAIQIKDFTLSVEDSTIALTINGRAQGDIESFDSKYTIKERTHEVIPIVTNKQTAFRLLLGAELRSNLKKFDYSLNLGLQNTAGNIYRVGYSKEVDGNYFMVGYDYSIFSTYRKQ